MKNQNLDINSIFKPVGVAFKRFHTTLFIIILVTGLAVAVLMLRTVITDASAGKGSSATTGSGAFDTATMERLRTFHTSDQALTPVELPSGRINPFSE